MSDTDAHPLACPWCGSREQYTDPWGTCAKCKVPWDKTKWFTGDVVVEEILHKWHRLMVEAFYSKVSR